MTTTQPNLFERDTPRRAMSRRMLEDAAYRLAQLEAYRLEHGSYDVPRDGEHGTLGDWLDKLRETFAKRPDGHRVRWVAQHAPSLYEHLQRWVATRHAQSQQRSTNIPFWISACWCFDFMRTRLTAPSQASADPFEVSLARWLSRWSNASACTQLQRRPFRHSAGAELYAIAEHFRLSLCAPDAAAAMFEAAHRTLTALADEEATGVQAAAWPISRTTLAHAASHGGCFWPTWQQWMARIQRHDPAANPTASSQPALAQGTCPPATPLPDIHDVLLRRRGRRRSKQVEPSALETFCEARGIAHRHLWVLIQSPGRPPHDRRYFLVLSLDGDCATVAVPLGRGQKRRYNVERKAIEDAVAAGRYSHSTVRPPFEPELDQLCRRLRIASRTVNITINECPYVPSFALDGIVTLTSGRKPLQKTIQFNADTFERRLQSPDARWCPAVLCTVGDRTVRYPTASDPDLGWLRRALLDHSGTIDLPTSTQLNSKLYGLVCSVTHAWKQLAALSTRLGEPAYGQAVLENRHALLHANEAGVRRLAGLLLYLMTTDRNSVLSRPVLGAFRRGEHGLLLDQIEDGWLEGDRLLASLAEMATKRKLHTVFI